MSYASELSFDLSPVRLSYAASLRGVKPLNPQDKFTYAQVGAFTPLNFLALAASNPQGTFYALISDDELLKKATEVASQRQADNVFFISKEKELPKNIKYICYENITTAPSENDIIFKLIKDHLAENGVLCYRYNAYDNQDNCLRFLIEEYTSELPDDKALDFLNGLKDLGTSYFKTNLIAQNALHNAIENKDPSSFFTTCIPDDNSTITSGTFEVMKELLQQHFSFAGSADITANYLQLSAPKEAHEELEKCKDHLFYEVIKDFATGQKVRTDIWVKQPVEQSESLSELFGFFTYGITMDREKVPSEIETKGANISFTSPLFTRLIDLMCTLPMTIGDFLKHPSGQGMEPDEVVAAIQVLVACKIAQPMRTHYESNSETNVQETKWAANYNEHITHLNMTEPTVQMASHIVGSPLTVPVRDALILQALNHVGMENCAGIVQPALEKIVKENPALAAKILDSADPTDEVVHNIITSTITKKMTSWYAYGLLAA